MCGITFVLRYLTEKASQDQRQEALEEVRALSKLLVHRGPIESDIKVWPLSTAKESYACMAHERLSIIDLTTGKQPILSQDETCAVIHNGEIYNHDDIDAELKKEGFQYRTHSDSECILHLYEQAKKKRIEKGQVDPLTVITIQDAVEFVSKLDGYFATVVYDSVTQTLVAARDRIGIKPLYMGRKKNVDGQMDSVWFASEMKVLSAAGCYEIDTFLPGMVYLQHSSQEFGVIEQYYNPIWFDSKVYNKPEETDLVKIREGFEAAVKKRMMSDVELGVFLSGGLDSSLVAALVKKYTNQPRLHSFSIGIGANESSDLVAARKVAAHLGTVHHEHIFAIDEGIAALEKVVYHLESYDVTTVRATTPMFLLSHLASQYIRVILSGEGSDEMFGGYVYFRDAKDSQQLQDEMVTKVRNLHLADVMRCDRATMAHGLEARVPFLDKDFLDTVMTIHPDHKLHHYHGTDGEEHNMEKFVLRKAFDGLDLIPDEILWRTKVQFGDGVGHGWIDSLKEFCDKQVTDEDFAKAAERFPYNTPISKEAYYYRTLFEKHFPSDICAKTCKKWLPWSKYEVDPSGRFQLSEIKKLNQDSQ
ncbi:asparagine synthetase [Naegleria gruberi]|uniref:asparagine synthase (glutamine-hydrolyzing) n=1 Tax=Naegleria gruberi TaxID=5762 RepID=D2V0C9_NAEGR|nr:asparagine synthetase [Naegleria gruberi]EFC49697.1 asparagine synthetase [Naegleria gruberi]|eukprot:XP_002682441.1 asparagine synthetase [Naegleria gruberi strain NEG-M]